MINHKDHVVLRTRSWKSRCISNSLDINLTFLSQATTGIMKQKLIPYSIINSIWALILIRTLSVS